MAGHCTREVCACGAVLLQCRCPSPKVDRVVQPSCPACATRKEPMSNPKNRFLYHAPTPEMVESMTVIRELCSKLDDALLSTPGHPRYIALARTRLEEVSMHANKGIVFLHEKD